MDKRFSSRLMYLYKQYEFVNKKGEVDFNKAANELYKRKIRNYTSDENTADQKKSNRSQLKNTADQMRKHTKADSAVNVSGLWLDMYCKLFNCSADFLLGYIDRPTQEKNDIGEVIGLSDQAIDTLKYIHQMHDKNHGADHKHLPILNKLLASQKEAMDLLHWLEILLYLDADLVIHKKGKNIYPDKNEPHGFRLIHKDNPNAYTAISVKDLIRADTYDKIKNTLADFIKKEQKRG